MSVETIKQNAEILNEGIIKFNSYLIELDSLKKGRENIKDKNTKRIVDEQIAKLNSKINEISTYIFKIQISIQKLIDEELSKNAD